MSRALVLSGGGPVGIGWQSGVVSSLAAAGIKLGDADVIIGTSAGSVVGSQIALGTDPAERFRQDLSNPPASSGNAAAAGMPRFMETMASVADLSAEERQLALGKFALEASTVDEATFVNRFSYLENESWSTGFMCTAINTADGVFRTWDPSSGVPLQLAVASSCAVPGVFPPVTVNGGRYYDGGLRSLENADLAEGHDKVLLMTIVKIPPEIDEPQANRYRARLDAQLEVLERSGACVEVIAPALGELGVSFMDPTLAQGAHEIGLRHGVELAERVRAFWN